MKMPVLFTGHGSPMNITARNSYTESMAAVGKALPKPEAILVVSAHWLTRGTYVTASPSPKTIYDFYGFPDELYRVSYPCPGSPETAALVEKTTEGIVRLDSARGIDHAAWAVLKHMLPQADIPVLELSLDVNRTPAEHYELGKMLAPLRRQGVLILGSGNVVHNLSLLDFDDTYGPVYPWAAQFDALIEQALLAKDHHSLIHYETLPQTAKAVPTNDHYLPLLYTLALQEADDELRFICTDIQNSSMAMRSFVLGG